MPLLDDPWLPAPDGDGLIPAWRRAIPVEVFRNSGTDLTPLPNVQCLWCSDSEGTDPGRAGFRYNFASGLEGAPTSIEQALSTTFTGPLVVEPGDRLAVRATLPDGSYEFLFDGYAVDFGLSLDPGGEEAPIGAIGVAWRLWDKPIHGAMMRDATDPVEGDDFETHLPAHFNPDGLDNCIPEDEDALSGSVEDGADKRYPVFITSAAFLLDTPLSPWTLPKACRYLLFLENADEEFVANPDGAYLDNLLVSPAGDPILVPDLPVTGKDLPSTVYQLIREVGFGMNFRLTQEDGLPRTQFRIFAQQAGDLKHLYLAPRGTEFSPTLFNVAAAGLHRDVVEVVNQWRVRGALERYEASFVLAPAFPMESADKSEANLKKYKQNDEEFDETNGDKYRLFVFDETGEGHYDVGTSAKVEEITSLDDLFGEGNYVPRRRKPIGELITRTGELGYDVPREATLWVSKDYAGPEPGLWDGTGNWQKVVSSGWRLADEVIGIEITDGSPNSFLIDSSPATDAPFPDGKINIVEALAAAGAGNFCFRLTCVIEGDLCVDGKAERTEDSPLPHVVERVVDASDRYRKEIIHGPSEFNDADGVQVIARDDEDKARAEAESIRKATEAGVMGGPVTIPRLTGYYKVGDRVGSIEGRGLGFRTDGGTGDPIYPVVVSRRFEFSGDQQSTTIELSDAGTDRRRYSRNIRRRTYGV